MTSEMLYKVYPIYKNRGDSYHGLSHIEELFDEFHILLAEGYLNDPLAVATALWYHDLYQRHDGEDEECSAKEAYTDCISAGYSEEFAWKVFRLILVTKHSDKYLPMTTDEMFMCDLDLMPFAAPNFAERTQWVRVEYPEVSDEEFYPGRKEVLRGFLTRKKAIYYTPYFQLKFGASARQNLENAIA